MLKPQVSRTEYESIELYLYGLRLFTETDDYFKIPIKIRIKLDEEMYYMQMTFSILSRIFEPIKSPRRSVVAWKKGLRKLTPDKIYHFTSAQVAGKALDVVPGDICRVASKKRMSTQGYTFMYLDDFNEIGESIYTKKKKFYE